MQEAPINPYADKKDSYMELLKLRLQQIMLLDKNYARRNPLIYSALGLAMKCGLAAGVRSDLLNPEWPVVYIELPTGQVSWHVPQHVQLWDEHTTEQKFERINTFIAQ